MFVHSVFCALMEAHPPTHMPVPCTPPTHPTSMCCTPAFEPLTCKLLPAEHCLFCLFEADCPWRVGAWILNPDWLN